jgi:hypothetical protein
MPCGLIRVNVSQLLLLDAGWIRFAIARSAADAPSGRESRRRAAYVLAKESIIIFPDRSTVMWNW